MVFHFYKWPGKPQFKTSNMLLHLPGSMSPACETITPYYKICRIKIGETEHIVASLGIKSI